MLRNKVKNGEKTVNLRESETVIVKIPKNKSRFVWKKSFFCSKQLKTKKRIDKKGKML